MKVIYNLDDENDSDIEEKIYEQIKKKRLLKKAQKEKTKENGVEETHTLQNIVTWTLENAKVLK